MVRALFVFAGASFGTKEPILPAGYDLDRRMACGYAITYACAEGVQCKKRSLLVDFWEVY